MSPGKQSNNTDCFSPREGKNNNNPTPPKCQEFSSLAFTVSLHSGYVRLRKEKVSSALKEQKQTSIFS